MGYLCVKRVALDFDWPRGQIWHGYDNPYWCLRSLCPRCRWLRNTIASCPECRGDGEVWQQGGKRLYDSWKPTEPPAGEWWQLWEDISEGSPVSPVFSTAEELASWLEKDAGRSTFDEKASVATWLAVLREGSVPAFVVGGGRVLSGVEWVKGKR